jgi:hypothetical protein
MGEAESHERVAEARKLLRIAEPVRGLPGIGMPDEGRQGTAAAARTELLATAL